MEEKKKKKERERKSLGVCRYKGGKRREIQQ